MATIYDYGSCVRRCQIEVQPGFVLEEALAEHGAAALMVDEQNHSAVRLYRSLGMRYRMLTAAYVT